MKIRSAEFIISAAGPHQFPMDRKPQIAFAGRSNVGKSSVINALLHRKQLVKTSATPGKTQLVNFFLINDAFYFVDLPGYGYGRAPNAVLDSWAPLIEGYLRESRTLAGVVVLLDSRRTADERDLQMMEWLSEHDIPALPVMTKTDKLNRGEADLARRELSAAFGRNRPLLMTSAKSGQGLKELWVEIGACMRDDAPRRKAKAGA